MRIVGVTGLPGAGKSLVTEISRESGISVVSMGDIVREEAKKRDENPGVTAVKLREEKGDFVLAEISIVKINEIMLEKSINEDKSKYSDLIVVEGIRSPHEVDMFKENFDDFTLVSVFSSPTTRFNRLKKRKRSDDSLKYEDFKKRDQRELDLGVGSVIACSDFIIINESDIDYYKKQFYNFYYKHIKK